MKPEVFAHEGLSMSDEDDGSLGGQKLEEPRRQNIQFRGTGPCSKVAEAIPEIAEAIVLLVGKIGSPVDRPAHVFADVKMRGNRHSAVQEKATSVLNTAISDGADFEPAWPVASPGINEPALPADRVA